MSAQLSEKCWTSAIVSSRMCNSPSLHLSLWFIRLENREVISACRSRLLGGWQCGAVRCHSLRQIRVQRAVRGKHVHPGQSSCLVAERVCVVRVWSGTLNQELWIPLNHVTQIVEANLHATNIHTRLHNLKNASIRQSLSPYHKKMRLLSDTNTHNIRSPLLNLCPHPAPEYIYSSKIHILILYACACECRWVKMGEGDTVVVIADNDDACCRS